MSNKVVLGSSQHQQYKIPTQDENSCPQTGTLTGTLTATVLIERDEEEVSGEGSIPQPKGLSPATPPKVVQKLKEYGVDSPLSRTITSWQSQFSPGRRGGTALHFYATATNPTVFATPGHTYVEKRKIGSGAESRVYEVLQFSPGGSSPQRKAAKFAKRSFENQQAAQRLVSPSGQKYIDAFESVSSVLGQRLHIGISSLGDCDLEHLSLDRNRRPIFTVVNISKNIAAGMASTHRSGQVHRDIKPANIVIFGKGDQAWAKVSDWGLVMKEKQQKHLTALTPQFAADFTWENLVDQRDRKGIQSKKTQVFSAGCTFLHGGVLKLFRHYQKINGVSLEDCLSQLEPTSAALPRTDRELLEISGPRGGPVIITFSGYVPSKVLFYPSQETLVEIFSQCISRLEPHLESKDLEMLQEYVNLVLSLQKNDPAHLPNMEDVQVSLEKILATYFPPIPMPLFGEEVEGLEGLNPQDNDEESSRTKRPHTPDQQYRPSASLPVGNEHKKRRVEQEERGVES